MCSGTRLAPPHTFTHDNTQDRHPPQLGRQPRAHRGERDWDGWLDGGFVHRWMGVLGVYLFPNFYSCCVMSCAWQNFAEEESSGDDGHR